MGWFFLMGWLVLTLIVITSIEGRDGCLLALLWHAALMLGLSLLLLG